ncbi:tyrosine-type recombinase/integrase [Aureimonas sp. AU4]|uniref:tyrosine-type recombinase/integrase n=1 Tax=Aureimonas sp. AU4 TaxID=1638163 RepID=UPI000A9D22B6|nr:DUF6538 domain-containing protein [Aureimonas sp. AU4]
MKAVKLIRRGDLFHLRRRVPLRFKPVEPREFVWISLRTDSESHARQKAEASWSHMVEAWEARLAGDTDDAERRFEAARQLAEARGFRYLPAVQVAKLPDQEFYARMKHVLATKGDPLEADAVLGGAKEPGITVSRALELFWDLAADRTIGKSDDQIRRWKNPRIKASDNFVRVVGDRELAAITADDMIDFRQWWSKRLAKEGLTPGSANKDFTHLADVWKTVVKLKRLGIALPLSDLMFKEGEKAERPPFSDHWIKTRLLAPGALDGLNLEARCILLAMVNTGCRPSELASLLPEHIHLNAPVPHISIEADGRQLKNAASRRVMPLVGVSLAGMKECPKGFPTYRFRDKVSDTVNKFLRENGLMESPTHVLYSLRHSFEDRLLAAGVDERIRRDLFGHTLNRERYGKGATLEHKQKVIQAIAF